MQKNILITGCSSGIGYCCATGLAKRGWRVLASCRRPEDVERLQQQGLECLQIDVADSASLRRGAEAALALCDGRLDALFNNAGYGQPGAAEDISREVLRAQFETNLFGAWELTNLLLPAMRAQGHGRVLFNSSILGFAAMGYRGPYNASKYAMEGLCDTLRLELAGSGIAVALIEPGPIESRFRANALAQFLANVEREHSAHRAAYQTQLQRLEKVGHAAPFTLPPEAVLDAVWRALNARHPAARYRVTLPTKLFWYLKRCLPTAWLDALLRRAA
jgi:NAD(P)-dependent dehydrogenase (short-subunit alcohol dehydrogenase family)